MHIEHLSHILMHSVVDAEGRKAIKKGTRLTPDHAARLRELGVDEVEVAVLAPNDVHEDKAAERMSYWKRLSGWHAPPLAFWMCILCQSGGWLCLSAATLRRMPVCVSNSNPQSRHVCSVWAAN